jgi:hypothetical protein
VESRNRSRLISSVSRRKYQTNLHDNIHYRSVEIDRLKSTVRGPQKVDTPELFLMHGFPTAGHMLMI